MEIAENKLGEKPIDVPTVDIRKHIYDFITKTIFEEVTGNVLEVGPMVYEFVPIKCFYVNTQETIEQKGCVYTSIDPYEKADVDYNIGIEEAYKAFNLEEFDTVLILDVIEHVKRAFEVPEILAYLIKPEGRLYLSTPFYFRLHQPFPDFWRFSEMGLRAMFEKDFYNIKFDTIYYDCSTVKPQPLHYNMTATRKDN